MNIRKSKRFYLLAIIFIAAAFSNCVCEEIKPTGKPDFTSKRYNVLFLSIELLRADHVGLLNPQKHITPNIDRFFKDSIIFEQATSAAGETYISSTATL